MLSLTDALGVKAVLRACTGFPCGSAGKETTCNARDLGLILGWEDPLEKGKATHSSALAWRVHGVTNSPTGLGDLHFHFQGLQVSLHLSSCDSISHTSSLLLTPKERLYNPKQGIFRTQRFSGMQFSWQGKEGNLSPED